MSAAFDLAILGSGFSGSLLAMAARRLGLSVLLVERGTHPRFAIGESTSPLTNLLLEELAREYDLPRVLPLAQYGTWKAAYPELTVGLKRGFSFYHHEAGRPFTPDPERERQLLVAASPNDAVADTHWFRAELDHFLVREAQDFGAEYVDRTEIRRLEGGKGGYRLEGERAGRAVSYSAGLVVDASGPRGAFSKLLGLPESRFAGYPQTEALFTHFTGVARLAEVAPVESDGAPYPPDDAALHHVFPGGWIWVLRFENGVTSAGIAAEEWLARELRLEEGAPAWERVQARYPRVREQFTQAKPTRPFIYAPHLAYRCGLPPSLGEEGLLMLPSASAFIDPLFSTGFPLTLLGVQRVAAMLRDGGPTPGSAAWKAYARTSSEEAEAVAALVGGSYRTFHNFPAFAALSMLYFTAASFSEMARRLERPGVAGQFLLGHDPRFRAAFFRHCQAAISGNPSLAEIGADMEPYNIAGLCDPGKRNWYGVDLEDTVRGTHKLGVSPETVRELFARLGL